jgi:hypothetical protein
MTTERMSDDDLIQRLRLCGVEAGVIDYARDAIASGETRETTIQRLRALGLCPQGFFDECDWHDVETPGDGPRAATPHPPPPIRPPQRASRGLDTGSATLGSGSPSRPFLPSARPLQGSPLRCLSGWRLWPLRWWPSAYGSPSRALRQRGGEVGDWRAS